MVREGIDATATNRKNWDAWAAVHGQDGYYDLDALVAGRDSLTDLELETLGFALGGPDPGLAGLDVLHVQCHLGLDAVSLARRGARVTGVDLSPVAVRRAAELAERCGVAVRYLEGDSTDLPAELHGGFDVAFATFGILCWIGDVNAWMRSVTACLRPDVTAAAGAGLRVLRLVEPLDSPVDLADRGHPEPDGRYRLRLRDQPVPMLFALVAVR